MIDVQEQLYDWGKSKTPFVFLIVFECKKLPLILRENIFYEIIYGEN